MKSEAALDQLNQFIKKKGLRYSKQREMIAKIFFSHVGHISVERLLEKSQHTDGNIGIATVYRTLNLLRDAGLAVKRDFETGDIVYEHAFKEHHDHLICTRCGQVIEFENQKIEALQEHISKEHGFVLRFHKMELYGLCPKCQS